MYMLQIEDVNIKYSKQLWEEWLVFLSEEESQFAHWKNKTQIEHGSFTFSFDLSILSGVKRQKDGHHSKCSFMQVLHKTILQ